jgi:diaminohydroxyphosphoribosylaminopyrimidine deaminase / 5-amino-6-(5-phosphoribosylamino)uracil reductase
MSADEDVMRHALALGRRGLGNTAPNPAVGAIVWHDTPQGPLIVGRGFTQKGGRPHAETEALRAAGEAARGAIMTVTLEPCSHHGKTPPCAEAIIAAGIKRVVTGLDDPDPRVAGRGHQLLRDAGIEVVPHILHHEALRANLGHVLRITQNRPMLTLKMAQTQDGFAGSGTDERLLITSENANARTQILRATHDAVLIGVRTAALDHPQLTVRLPGLEDQQPIRIIADPFLTLDAESALARSAKVAPLWLACLPQASDDKADLLEDLGIEIIRIPSAMAEGRLLDLNALMRELAARGLTRILCEGGPRFGGALIKDHLVDELIVMTAPVRVQEGLPAFDPVSLDRIQKNYRLTQTLMADPDQITVYERMA